MRSRLLRALASRQLWEAYDFHRRADLVLGARVAQRREPGAIPRHTLWGNRLVTTLLRWRWDVRFADLGPFRAIRWPALQRLGLEDRDFGWNVEMQIRATRVGLRVAEVPVSYRRRIGRSKISGTTVGSVRAGVKTKSAINSGGR